MSFLNLNPFSRFFYSLLLACFLITIFNISIPAFAQASPYRLIYTVDNTGILINNYQVEVILDTASVAYNFWVKSGCNTVSTKIIVNIPAVNTGTTTFWLDYGNFSLTSLSNPAATTVFSDQMLTSTTCTLGGSAIYDATNQWVRLNSVTQGSGSCNYNYNPGNGFKAKFDFWSGGGTSADSTWFYAFDTSIPNQEDVTTGGYHFTYDEYQDRVCFTRSNIGNGAGIACGSVTNLDNSTWKSAEVRYYNHQAWMYIDNVLIATAVNPAPIASTTGNFFGFASRTGGLTNEHRIRKTYVSKFSPFITLNAPSEQVFMSMNIRDVNNSINLNTCDFGIANTLTIQSLYPNLPLIGDTTNTILMTHNLNISPGTPAGNYSQKITYSLVAGF